MHVFKPARELLPPHILTKLSPLAARLYAHCWNKMAILGKPEFASLDVEVSRRAKVPLSDLRRCQEQLQRECLMEFEFETRLGFSMEARCTAYMFPELDDEPSA